MKAPAIASSWLAVVACACLLLSADPLSQTRDAAVPPRPVRVGTGLITGRVVTDDTPNRPLRRVTVSAIDSGAAMVGRVAITDDAGRFVFRNLPAGRYTVSATRAPYLPTSYGARRLSRPGAVQTGTPIALADGQQIADVTLKLSRGAVVTGTVRDATGQPAQGFSVSLSYFQRSFTTGERTLTPYYSGSSSATDDRGVYRIYGLPPGEYMVSASTGFGRMTDLVPTTDADVQRAMDLIQRPGAPQSAVGPAVPAPAPRRPTVGYVPVFFPGTTVLANATPITLGAGEERSSVDFQVQLVSTARVEGTVVGPDGAPIAGVSVRMFGTGPAASSADLSFVLGSSAVSDAQGRFALTGVPPGAYSIQARTSGPGAGPAGAPMLWAAADVTIQGEDAKVDLALQPGLTASGRLVFDGTSPPLQDLSKIRVALSAVTTGVSLSPPSATSTATGEFTLNGVTPGRYRLVAMIPGIPSAGSWVVKSATLNGQDTLDAPAEIAPTQGAIDAVITLTDRSTEISGAMTDASNKPAPEYFIIAFPADRSYWTPQSRRIMQTRPAHDGKFTFRNLPPGEYLIAAVTDVEQGEWFDPTFLSQLVEASVKVTLAENEKKVQDIRVR